MALVIKDRVYETTSTTGTGTITLAGASTGFRSFADIGNANTTYYTIVGGSEWEVGIGTYTTSGTTLSRDTVLSNSLGTTANIVFSVGTKDVFCTYPSSKAILGDTSTIASTGTGSVVLSDSPTFTTAITSTGALQLTGDATTAQNIATTQTTGSLTIGGTGATGSISLGQSTGAQAINIGNGAATTSTVNIGGTGLSTGSINIGRGTGTQSINIGSGNVTTGQTRTINIGTASAITGISNVNIGKFSTTVAHTTSVLGNTCNFTVNNATVSASAGFNIQAGASGMTINTGSGSNTTIGALGNSDNLTVNHDNTIINSGIIRLSTLTASQAVFTDASKNLVSVATTGTGSVVLATSPTLVTPTLTGLTETVVAVTGTTPALTPTTGTIQTWTLSGASTPTAGTWAAGQSMTMMITAGANTITWTSVAVTWVGGVAPTLASSGVTIIELWKVGSTIYGAYVGSA